MPRRFNRWAQPPRAKSFVSRWDSLQDSVASVRALLERRYLESDIEFAVRSLSEVFAAQAYVAAPPASAAIIAATEERLEVRLPPELRALAQFADGSGTGLDGSGCDMDGVRFWPLNEWKLDEVRPTRVVIADYREESWRYSAASMGDAEPGAVSIAGFISGKSPTLYHSIAEFVKACAFDRLFEPLLELRASSGDG